VRRWFGARRLNCFDQSVCSRAVNNAWVPSTDSCSCDGDATPSVCILYKLCRSAAPASTSIASAPSILRPASVNRRSSSRSSLAFARSALDASRRWALSRHSCAAFSAASRDANSLTWSVHSRLISLSRERALLSLSVCAARAMLALASYNTTPRCTHCSRFFSSSRTMP